jgi:hypothetical protein
VIKIAVMRLPRFSAQSASRPTWSKVMSVSTSTASSAPAMSELLIGRSRRGGGRDGNARA